MGPYVATRLYESPPARASLVEASVGTCQALMPAQRSKVILLDQPPRIDDSCPRMTTTLSSKGQVVLPRLVRSKLHLAPGTKLLCEIQGDSVLLTPEHPTHWTREYVTDPLTGLQVTKDSEPVTTEMVKALLEDYP